MVPYLAPYLAPRIAPYLVPYLALLTITHQIGTVAAAVGLPGRPRKPNIQATHHTLTHTHPPPTHTHTHPPSRPPTAHHTTSYRANKWQLALTYCLDRANWRLVDGGDGTMVRVAHPAPAPAPVKAPTPRNQM